MDNNINTKMQSQVYSKQLQDAINNIGTKKRNALTKLSDVERYIYTTVYNTRYKEKHSDEASIEKRKRYLRERWMKMDQESRNELYERERLTRREAGKRYYHKNVAQIREYQAQYRLRISLGKAEYEKNLIMKN